MFARALITVAFLSLGMHGNAVAQAHLDWDDLLLGRVVDHGMLTVSVQPKLPVSKDPNAGVLLSHLVAMNLAGETSFALIDRSMMQFVTLQITAGIKPYATLAPFHVVQRWVAGTVVAAGAGQRINVRIIDVETGNILKEATTTTLQEADLVAVARFMASEARRILSGGDVSTAAKVEASSGVSPVALAAYAGGVKLESDGAFAEAGKKYHEAAAATGFSEAERAIERIDRVLKWLNTNRR